MKGITREQRDNFLAALNGGRGELDAWLECNSEEECRAVMQAAITAPMDDEARLHADDARAFAAAWLPVQLERWRGEDKFAMEGALELGREMADMAAAERNKRRQG